MPYAVLRVQGHLDAGWSSWFDGLTVTVEADGSTRLAGPVADQAALHGLLTRVRDLNLALLSVAWQEAAPADADPPGSEHTPARA